MKSIQSLVFEIKNTLQDADHEGLLREQKWKKLNAQFERDYKKIQNVSPSVRMKLKKTALRRSMDAQSGLSDNDPLILLHGKKKRENIDNGYGSTNEMQQQQQE